MALEAQGDRNEEWLNVTCPVCGKKFHLKPYKLGKDKNHYCSRTCHYKAKKQYCVGSGNHQYGLRGEKNASWRGGRKKSNYGYWLVQCIDHPFAWDKSGYVFEHRLIAEKYLLTEENSVVIDGKRYLSPEYDVHHINEIKTDNRPENLVVMKRGEHSRIHNKERNRKMVRDEKGRYIKSVEIVDSIKSGERGERGFGSTGR